MMSPEPKRPVTLENLLQLKRAERPAPEFWDRFDRELRAKQLSALVEKRPWWKTFSFPKALVSLPRYYLPLGATAALAVAFIVAEHSRGPGATHLHSQTVPVAALADVTPAADDTAVATAAATSLKPVTAAMAHTEVSAVVSPAPVSHSLNLGGPIPGADSEVAESEAKDIGLSSDATMPGEITQMVALLGDRALTASQRDESPSARSIAANFAAAQAANPGLVHQILGNAKGFETHVIPAASRPAPAEPLAQMASPADLRRARIQSAVVPAVAYGVSARGTDRSVKELSDDRLYDQISRVNARGAGVAVKF